MSCSLAEFTKSWITARGAEDREGERERRRGAGGNGGGGYRGALLATGLHPGLESCFGKSQR